MLKMLLKVLLIAHLLSCLTSGPRNDMRLHMAREVLGGDARVRRWHGAMQAQRRRASRMKLIEPSFRAGFTDL